MSSSTWTPAAVASEGRAWAGSLWRAVEAQHRVSTLKLVDTLAEQLQLEQLLESSKPRLPQEYGARHYLLVTPFRYAAPQPRGSRFRGLQDQGVFYAADERRTACAELGYWRWRFLQDSPALTRLDAVPHTLFRVGAAGRAIDLAAVPFVRDAVRWMARDDYSATQALGDTARAAKIDVIRYSSVRDPQAGACAAVLVPGALALQPDEEQTWHLSVTHERVQWRRDSVLIDERFEFDA
ncbi:MAG: RES family NAD+ phosphorylase [Pseudomonadota bacterium]